MLFDLNPKESVKDLYDRSEELKELSDSLKRGERLSIIYGLRRVGKTSLIHAFLNEMNFPYILIDMKEVYAMHGSVSIKGLYAAVAKEFFDFTEKLGLEPEISLGGDSSLTELLKDMNTWCKENKLTFIIALDEAQYLRFGGGVKYDMMLAWSIDNLSNITYILTGSEAGMLKEFLDYGNVEAPLYGRFRNEIYLNRFTEEQSIAFLKQGFKETKKTVSKEELEDVRRNLDGIIGWLTYYGYYRTVKNMAHEEAIQKVFSEGAQLTEKEIESVIFHSRKRYIYLLKAIVDGLNTWSVMKAAVEAKGDMISDTVLNSLLQTLVKLGIVEKVSEDKYVILDPIAIAAIKKLKP